ncbi:hypothetical protein HDU81_000193, partial [Chytriomyces hyalinus]
MLLFGQAHFYDAYVDLLEVQSKVPSLETAQAARHAFELTNWSCYASEYLEMLKIPVSRFVPKYEPGKQAIGFPINAVATSFSDDKSLAGLVRIIKKLKEDGSIYDVTQQTSFYDRVKSFFVSKSKQEAVLTCTVVAIALAAVFKYKPVPGGSTAEAHLRTELWSPLLSYIFKLG